MFQILNILGVTINPATEDTLAAYELNQRLPVNYTVYNTTLTLVDTEYSQAFAPVLNPVRRFEFQARTAVDVRFAFVTGKVATSVAPYMTLKAGRYFDSGPVYILASTGTVLYLASGAAGTVVEILIST